MVKHAYKNDGWEYSVTSEGKYQVNDTGIKYVSNRDNILRLIEYKIIEENGKTYMLFRHVWNAATGSYDEWLKYEKQDMP